MNATIAGLVALAVAMGIGRFAFTPLLPVMQAELALDVVAGGWLASANYGGYLVGGLSAVALPLRSAAAIRSGLATVALSTLAMGLTSSLPAWLALRAIAGVGSAWVLVFAGAWCLERFQADATLSATQRTLHAATLYSGVGIGIAVAGLLCLVLLVLGVSSRGAWLLLGGVSIATAAALWNRFGAGPPEPGSQAGAPLRWNAYHVRMVVCYGALGFGYIVPATFLAAMAREVFPDPGVYGWSWPIFGAAAAASTFVAAVARRTRSERALWIAGHGIMAAGVAVPLVVPGIAGIVLAALLVGGTFMMVTMVGMQEARRVAGPAARPLMAALTSAFALGQIAGPLLVSALAAHGLGYDAALVTSAVALLAGAILLAPSPRGNFP